MKTPVFTGSATAIVTPYDRDGVDYDLFARMIDRQAEGHTDAIVVCATTGEAPVLSASERALLISVAVRQAAGRMKVIAGIGGNNTEGAVRAAGEAEILGADGVLLTAPYYNKSNARGMCEHFFRVADAVGIPLIVYNVPGRTAVSLDETVYARLAEHPRINGVKEASGDISLVSRTIAACGDEFSVWSGNDDQTLPMMALGARGVISVASNVIPGEMAQMTRLCLEGDFLSAGELHRRWTRLFSMLFIEVNPIPVKEALRLMGLDHGVFRPPLFPLEEGHREALEDCLRDYKLIV